MVSLAQALESLKETSSNPTILSLIEQQESLLAATAASTETPDFDSVLSELLAGRQLLGDPERNVDILTHIVLNLYHTVVQQEEEIENLHVEVASYEQDPEDLKRALSNFRESLRNAQFKDLVARYTAQYLRQFKPTTRKLIAQELSEYVLSINRRPTDLWISAINNNGHI